MRDIQHHLASTLSAGAQRGDHFEDHRRGLLRLSRVWQHASAGGALFPVVYHGRDPGRWSAPVHRVASRSAHIAVGVDMDGIKHVA